MSIKTQVRGHHPQQEDHERRPGALWRNHAGARRFEAGFGPVRGDGVALTKNWSHEPGFSPHTDLSFRIQACHSDQREESAIGVSYWSKLLGGEGLQACDKSLFLFVGFSRWGKVY